jgi:hypothetical protein
MSRHVSWLKHSIFHLPAMPVEHILLTHRPGLNLRTATIQEWFKDGGNPRRG